MSPDYLVDILSVRQPVSSHNIRSNTDNLMLELLDNIHYKKSLAMFSFAAVNVWNDLPFSIRHCNSVSQFKINLKTCLFHLAFDDIADLPTNIKIWNSAYWLLTDNTCFFNFFFCYSIINLLFMVLSYASCA